MVPKPHYGASNSLDARTNGQTANKNRLQGFLDSEKLMIAWLDLMANYSLVLIHRPALTFDQNTACFRESLNVAVKASTAILRLASSSVVHRRAVDCAPFGSAVVFQSALMQIFNSCLGEFGVLSAQTEQAQTTIREAIQILQDMLERSNTNHLSQKESFQPAVTLLSMLSTEFLTPLDALSANPNLPSQHLNTVNSSQEGNFGLNASSIPLSSFPRGEGEHGGIDYWNTSALEGLNHLDIFATDWDGVDLFGSQY